MAEISKTADQALSILLCVANRAPIGTAAVARELGLNRTVVHRLLTTLHGRGFVRRDRSGGYLLGAAVVRLAQGIEPELRATARPVMSGLTSATGETTLLTVRDGDMAMAVEQCIGTRYPLRVQYELGSRRPIRLGAAGRAILAYCDDALVRDALRDAEDPAAVRRRLAEVRRRGHAISHDELQLGVHGAAAPIRDENGSAVASLSVLVPAPRASTLAAHVDALVAAADSLQRDLGGHRW